jgi:hypothetical protein
MKDDAFAKAAEAALLLASNEPCEIVAGQQSCERILGPGHPSTLTMRANLAGAVQALGDHATAAGLLRETLSAASAVLDAMIHNSYSSRKPRLCHCLGWR